MKIQQIV